MKAFARFLFFVLAFVLAAFISINLHEIGHTVLARIFGDPTASYSLYRYYANGSFCIGCTDYDTTRLSYLGNTLVSLGGILFTQVAALTLILLTSGRRMTRDARGLNHLLLLVFISDLPFQMIQGLARYDGELHSGVDLADVVGLLSYQTPISPATWMILLSVVTILYLSLILWLYWSGMVKSADDGPSTADSSGQQAMDGG